MPWYRKKVLTYAEPYRLGLEDGMFCELEGKECDRVCNNPWKQNPFECQYCKVYINTLEGRMFLNGSDDFIATGSKGERYPIRRDIFEQTYELVEEKENY